jgi:hypothetical protein
MNASPGREHRPVASRKWALLILALSQPKGKQRGTPL